MKQVLGCISLLLAAAGALSAQDGVSWVHDWNEGLKAAKDSGKPIFVMFTAEW